MDPQRVPSLRLWSRASSAGLPWRERQEPQWERRLVTDEQVTALSPVIGYDKASKIAHYALDNDLSLKAAALKLGFVTEADFDRIVDPAKMIRPYVATEASVH